MRLFVSALLSSTRTLRYPGPAADDDNDDDDGDDDDDDVCC